MHQNIQEGGYLEEGVRIIELPGHTPGVAGLLFEADGVFITGDALKNPHDLNFMDPGMCFDTRENGVRSLNRVKQLAKVVVPGHDAPFFIKDGQVLVLDRPSVTITHYLDWKSKAPARAEITKP